MVEIAGKYVENYTNRSSSNLDAFNNIITVLPFINHLKMWQTHKGTVQEIGSGGGLRCMNIKIIFNNRGGFI